MSIVGGDPLELLLYQQGQIGAPLTAGAAAGADALDTAQRAITIGEPVPIVFGRRREDGTGGVLISPGASEARFENSLTNEVTAYYRLVLSEGELEGVQVRDVFQRSCRVGAFSQAYELRAGTWAPGNFIIERVGLPKPEASYYCGTGGSYDDITTGSFQITAPAEDTRWDRQVHLFIRGGMKVTRLLDAVYGPSDNFADLVLWLIQRTSRVPAALIDTPALEAAAAFTDNTGLRFNAWLRESSNLEDFIATHARYMLLAKSKKAGKIGLRPLLPTTNADEIDTGTIAPVTLFDESRVIPDSFEISWVPLAERKPVCLLMLWRQQPEDDLGLIRTTEVRYKDTAADGPYEQHDLSAFATSELHAVRVGAYILARRRYVTHTLRIRARPSTTNQQLSRGDIVQVQLQRTASSAAAGEHNYLYEIDRIGKARDGTLAFDLVHFPVDSSGRSLVALDVVAATASGVLLETGKADAVTCDVNSSTDETVPTDGTLDPVDVEGLEAGGDPFTDTGDGSGVGGGSEASPGDGTPEGEELADVQQVLDLTTPPAVGIGEAVPAEWRNLVNAQLNAGTAGVQLNLTGNGASQWSITVQAVATTLSVYDSLGRPGGFGASFGALNTTFTSTTSAITVRPAFVDPTGGVGPYFHWDYGVYFGALLDVALYDAGLLPGLGKIRGVKTAGPGGAGWYPEQVAEFTPEPFIEIVSMTRTA